MANYSFCVRKKGEEAFARGSAQHALPFLDYFATRFNSKEELLKFLGLNPDEYDDIRICYNSEHQVKTLPIYFDARELEEMAISMLDFGENEVLTERFKIVAAYQDRNSYRVSGLVPKTYITTDILKRLLYGTRPMRANERDLLHDRAYNSFIYGRLQEAEDELLKSYLSMRKVYTFLREDEAIQPCRVEKPTTNQTMEEVQNNIIFVNFNTEELGTYECNLIMRVNSGDEAAYDELMGLDIEQIEKLTPYVNVSRRGDR